MYIVPKDVVAAMKSVYDAAPKWLKDRAYILFVNGQPIFNVRRDSCTRWDSVSGRCGVTCMCLVKHGEHYFDWEERTVTIDQQLPTVDYSEWMDRCETDDERTVDFIDMKQAEQVVADHKRAHEFNWDEYYRVPSKWTDVTTYKCMTLVGDKYHPCLFHSLWEHVKQALAWYEAGEIQCLQCANLLVPWALRTSKWIPEIPHGDWTHNDRANFYATIDRFALNLRLKYQDRSEASCYYFASKSLHSEHPECKEYEKNLPKVKNGSLVEHIKLNKSLKEQATRDALRELKRHGVETTPELACRVHGLMFAGTEKEREASLMAGCPICTGKPKDGELYPLIIRHTAVTDRLKEITSDMVLDGGKRYVVRTRKCDMDAAEFNKLPLEERKALLDCVCSYCTQKDIFVEKLCMDGRKRFIVAAEVLLNETEFEGILSILTRATELGEDLLPSTEEADFRNNLSDINCDFTDYEEISGFDDDRGSDYSNIDWTSLDHRQQMRADLNIYTEPVKTWVDKSIIRKPKSKKK